MINTQTYTAQPIALAVNEVPSHQRGPCCRWLPHGTTTRLQIVYSVWSGGAARAECGAEVHHGVMSQRCLRHTHTTAAAAVAAAARFRLVCLLLFVVSRPLKGMRNACAIGMSMSRLFLESFFHFPSVNSFRGSSNKHSSYGRREQKWPSPSFHLCRDLVCEGFCFVAVKEVGLFGFFQRGRSRKLPLYRHRRRTVMATPAKEDYILLEKDWLRFLRRSTGARSKHSNRAKLQYS